MKEQEIFESYIVSEEYYQNKERQPKLSSQLLTKMRQYEKRLDQKTYEEIEDMIYAALSLGEKQGFINGYHYIAKQ